MWEMEKIGQQSHKQPDLVDGLCDSLSRARGVEMSTRKCATISSSRTCKRRLPATLERECARAEVTRLLLDDSRLTPNATPFSSLSHMFQTKGVHCWRDMTQKNLTEEGMQQGVEDSDVFLLFLTNSMLSRPWCLKEIGWALQAKKPIITIVEEGKLCARRGA